MKQINFIRIMVCLALLVGQFAIPTPVSACSCVLPGPPIEAFRDYAAVFIGKVTAISRNYSPAISHIYRTLETLNLVPNYFYKNKSWGYDVTFTVHKSWKDVGTTSVTLRTGSGGGDCGYVFNRGDDYLVYAYKLNDDANNELAVSSCSRTTEISGATEDLSYLNTIPTLPLTPVYNYSWLYFAGIILFVIVICVWAIIILIRRQRPKKIGDLS